VACELARAREPGAAVPAGEAAGRYARAGRRAARASPREPRASGARALAAGRSEQTARLGQPGGHPWRPGGHPWQPEHEEPVQAPSLIREPPAPRAGPRPADGWAAWAPSERWVTRQLPPRGWASRPSLERCAHQASAASWAPSERTLSGRLECPSAGCLLAPTLGHGKPVYPVPCGWVLRAPRWGSACHRNPRAASGQAPIHGVRLWDGPMPPRLVEWRCTLCDIRDVGGL
jgi:hypothetical protein